VKADSYGSFRYSYAPGNQRNWRGAPGGTDELAYYGITGQKIATYSLSLSGSTLTATQTATWYYFGGKLIKNADGWVGADRLGSVGNKFFPYGQERTATANGKEKFATYFRDSETGLDYAQNRYHQPGMGRFLTPDRVNGALADPGSWNKYAYVAGDPINYYDPNGLSRIGADEGDCVIDGLVLPVGLCSMIEKSPEFLPIQSIPRSTGGGSPIGQVNLPGFSESAYFTTQGRTILSTVNWDVVFGFIQASAPAIPFPMPGDFGWSITVDGLLNLLKRFPALIALSASIGSISDTQGHLPPNPSRCPDKDHFNDPTKPPHEGWTWKGPDAPGGPAGAWVSPSGSESLHPDLNHPPGKPPHWDYRDPFGDFWECYEDGTISRRKNQ
jgi:RHS repeat-associated protein